MAAEGGDPGRWSRSSWALCARPASIHTLQETGDIRRVAFWLGHSSIVSTKIYLRIDPAEKLDILDVGAPPLIKKGTFAGVSDRLLAMLTTARGQTTK